MRHILCALAVAVLSSSCLCWAFRTDLQSFLLKHEMELEQLRKKHERDREQIREEVELAQNKYVHHLQREISNKVTPPSFLFDERERERELSVFVFISCVLFRRKWTLVSLI